MKIDHARALDVAIRFTSDTRGTEEMLLAKAYIELSGQMEEAREVLNHLLSNVACDWYVDQFTKSTAPNTSAARIHNSEVNKRAKIAFMMAREFLSRLDALEMVK